MTRGLMRGYCGSGVRPRRVERGWSVVCARDDGGLRAGARLRVRSLDFGREREAVADAEPGRRRRMAVGMALVAVFVALAVSSACGGSGAAVPGRVRVSAAISLTEPLQRVAAGFERETGTPVELNLAGSSTLAAQILAGAPVDVFVSADERQLDRVAAESLLDPATRVVLLSNRLAVVVPGDGNAPARGAPAERPVAAFLPSANGDPADLPASAFQRIAIGDPADLLAPAFRRIAVGDPAGVPAGVYARSYLVSLGLWDALAPRLVPTRSVRAALAVVEAGDADAGIVYRTDALSSDDVAVAFEVAADEGPAIAYPAAVLADAPNPAGAARFLAHLQRPAARDAFRQAGFVVPAPALDVGRPTAP